MTVTEASDLNVREDNAQTDPILHYVFSFLLVGVTFKQLPSIAGANVFQLLLAIALPIVVFKARRQWQHARPLLIAASVVCLCLLAGGALRAMFGEGETVSARDTLAYLFTYLIVCASLMLFLSNPRALLASLGYVISAYLMAVTIAGYLPFEASEAVWYYGVKLQGLSDNPNQIGFLAAIGLGVLAADELTRRPPRLATLVASFACAIAGYLSGSAAFLVALLAAVSLVVGRVGLDRKGWSRDQIASKVPAALATAFITVTVILSASQLIKLSLRQLGSIEFVESLQKMGLQDGFKKSVEEYVNADGGQGAVRFQLWTDASKMILSSPLIGYGPGQHLKATGDPKPQEAHNTLLDILLISGLAGALAVLAIFVLILKVAYQNSRLYLVLLLLGPILAFGMFHYIGRQPLFWIALLMAWYIAQQHSVRADDGSTLAHQSPAR